MVQLCIIIPHIALLSATNKKRTINDIQNNSGLSLVAQITDFWFSM